MSTIRSIRFDRAAGVDASAPTTAKEWYRDPTGTFKSGFWAAKPGRAAIDYKYDELCVLLDGVVRLTDANGQAEIYRAGDTCLIPKGFKGEWETVEPVRKFYAVFKPTGS
jgi:uncharacterized cupin superfamily protein